jgi:hypothetical protein
MFKRVDVEEKDERFEGFMFESETDTFAVTIPEGNKDRETVSILTNGTIRLALFYKDIPHMINALQASHEYGTPKHHPPITAGHTCPYKGEIDNDYKTLCNCDPLQEAECAAAV